MRMQIATLPSFTLSSKLTPEQTAFFKKNGALKFKGFLDKDTVKDVLREANRVEKEWLDKGIEKVNGIPLKFGKNEHGGKTIQRLCFLSQHSPLIHEILQDSLLKSLIELVLPFEGRIGEAEKDGLVLNNYIRMPNSAFSQMGWHTDSPRDLFLGQRIMPMLNIGIHLDDCPFENGGLRIIPGTHKQGIIRLLFEKKYFIDHTPDPKEVGFNIEAGDLTVHDGRLWHRVQQSPHTGELSRRRVMYIPIVTGKYVPKNSKSKTPFYHRFSQAIQD